MSRPEDQRSPVIVGVGQVVQRPTTDGSPGERGPIELMIDAARVAADDAGVSGLLGQVGWIGVAGGWFAHRNPGALIAPSLGCNDAATAMIGISGTAPQDLLGVAASRIAAGQLDVALVVGGEARWSAQRLERAGRDPQWVTEPGEGDPETWPMYPDAVADEGRVFGGAPPGYALFEDSLRVAHRRSIAEQRDVAAQLWSGFSAVAETNPFAWDQQTRTAASIREPGPDNRMVAFPYTKAMVANNTVDMASAVLICSVAAAEEAGVSSDRMVFPHVVASSRETWTVATRPALHASPGLAAAGRAAFRHSGIGPGDLSQVDLYACFPSIVQMSTAALGIDAARPLTVTGGLGFAGGAVGNAVGHSIATMVGLLRRGGVGLVHGNGGMATKHSVGIYGPRPAGAFAAVDATDHDLAERATLATDWAGPVTVEAATVVFDRDGPSHLLAAVLDGSGARGFAISKAAEVLSLAMDRGVAGSPAHRAADGTLEW